MPKKTITPVVEEPSGLPEGFETKHLVWMASALVEHFSEKIKDTEAEIVRLERFIDDPGFTKYSNPSARTRSRKQQIDSLQQSRSQYIMIYQIACQMSERATEASAAEFAEMIRSSGLFKR